MSAEDHPSRQASGRTKVITCACGLDKVRFVQPLLLCPRCDGPVIRQHKEARP